MAKITQKQTILEALRKNPKGMTDYEMSMKLGIARPSMRISELRRGIGVGKPYNIVGTDEKVKTRWGEKMVKRYRLIE